MKILNLLESLLAIPSVSGNEFTSKNISYLKHFPYFSEAKIDSVGNILLTRYGNGVNKKKILLEAHRDTVGLIVDQIYEGGFASVISAGGFDLSIIPGTEFFTHGKEAYLTVASSVPPHLLEKKDDKSKNKIENIYLDLPFETKKEAEKHISIGDFVTFSQKAKKMENGHIVSPYLDNFAAVIALLLAYESNKAPYHDLYFLFSVGEETTSRGVCTFFGEDIPDIAFVFDAGFGFEEGMQKSGCASIGQGASISFTDTLSRELESFLLSAARRSFIPLQVLAEPGGTGTSATAIQLLGGGTPCCLISIPVLNMHTPAEIVNERDILSAVDIVSILANEMHFPCGEVFYV